MVKGGLKLGLIFESYEVDSEDVHGFGASGVGKSLETAPTFGFVGLGVSQPPKVPRESSNSRFHGIIAPPLEPRLVLESGVMK